MSAIMLPSNRLNMPRGCNRSFQFRHFSAQAQSGAEGNSPSRYTLEGFVAQVSRGQGIDLAELEPLTFIRIQTLNTVYEVVALEPQGMAMLVRGGRLFPDLTEVGFSGSSLGGSCLKPAWIGIGLNMEFRCDRGTVVTSGVRSIQLLDGVSLLGPL